MGPGDTNIDCSCCTGSKLRRYLRSKVPCLQWMKSYNLQCLQGDLIAGLTVGMMVIPQGLAYAHLAELPPNYGLYASFVGILVYIFTGTSKDLTIGPTAIMSQIVAEVAKGNTKLALTCSLFAGSFQILMGLFFLGFVVWVISTPILCGFTTAAALTIGCGQLPKLLGIKGVRRQFWQSLYDTFSKIKSTQWPDAVLGLVCLILLFSLRYLQKWTEKKRNRVHLTLSSSRLKAIKTLWFVGVSRNIIIVIGATVTAYFITAQSAPDSSKKSSFLWKCLWMTGISRNIIVVIIASAVAYAIHSGSHPFTMVGKITGGLPKPRIDQFSGMFDSSESACDASVPEHARWTCQTDKSTNITIQESHCLSIGCCWDATGNTTCYSKGFEVSEILSGSVLVAAIGYLEHIAIGQSFAVKGSYQIDNSQELIALGLGNVIGSFFSSYPVTGSFSRTALNYMTGVMTPLGGFFTSAIVVLGLSLLSEYFQFVPDACLAAIIIVAVYPMVDFEKPVYLWKVAKREFLVWLVCFVLILAMNIEVGILAAICLEIIIIMGRNMWPTFIVKHLNDGIYDVKIDGTLWYLGAFTLKEKLSGMINGVYKKDNPGKPSVSYIIIDFSTVTRADTTVLDKIKEVVILGAKKEVRVMGYGLSDFLLARAAKQGLLQYMRVEKTQKDAARSVPYIGDESAQPAYLQFDDSIISPKLVEEDVNSDYKPLPSSPQLINSTEISPAD